MSIKNHINILDSNNSIVGYITGFKLQILRKNGFYEIFLDNLILNFEFQLCKGDLLHFQLSGQNKFVFSMYSFENININLGIHNKIIIKASLESYIKRYSVNFYISLIDSWAHYEQIYHWSKLSLFQKRIWLDASMYWNGIKSEIINKDKDILVYSKNINVKEDLFCYLGELVFGYGGYLGSNLDSLDDCLSQIQNKNTYTLHFLDHLYLKNVLNKSSKKYNKSYTNIVFDVLKKNELKFKKE